jgi:hypothetical protein
MKVNTESGMKPNSFRPIPEPRSASPESSMGHKDVRPAVQEITALPLEKRYTWRVASALKWAFVDFENLNVVADRRTLSQEDLDTLVDLREFVPFSSACSLPRCLAKNGWRN